MSKLTTERLEYYAALPIAPAEGDGFFKKGIFMYEVRRMARQLLAYEQAARNSDLKTLVISEIVDFYSGFESPCEPETVDEAQRQLIGRIEKVFGLAAPVLPKQPVIPEGLIKAINRLLDNDGSRGCFDALEQHRAKTELEILLAAAQQNEPQNIPENIPAQHDQLERELFKAWNNDIDCPIAGLDPSNAAWKAWISRSAIAPAQHISEQKEPDLYLCRVTRMGENLYSKCGKDYHRGRGYYAAPIPAQPVSEPKAEGDFLSRLKAEHVEIEDRCIKLANFIQVNPEFKKLAPRMQRLLESQAAAMVEYDSILERRIYLIEDASAPAQESE